MKTVKTIVFSALALMLTQFAVAQSHDAFAAVTVVEPVKSAKLFPNPAADFLSIKFEAPVAKTVKVTLHNIIGNSIDVESEIVDEFEIRLRVKDLPTGYYLIALKDEGNARSSFKFLKH
ncbi:MAG TPA: T9SS type A sorting domain-containing protein [Cyclobacteriaceae bacterium]|nr:T9SS type A sorting domain-containing protein [Cyclobacteriaceae bacterium]